MRVSPGPVTQAERVASIDVLRGFALLGILPVNMWMFSMIAAAYFNPAAFGDLGGINLVAWIVVHVLFDQKFMTLFSLLFGAGIVLMADRAVATGRSAAGVHYRRMFWLLLFGLAHAYFVWPGDILVLYAVCGAGVFLFREFRPGWLVALGLAALLMGSLLSLFAGLTMPFWPEADRVEFVESQQPDAATIEAEVEAYRGSWSEQNVPRWEMAREMHYAAMWWWGIWRAGGLMLVGMALYKTGVLNAARGKRFYRRLAVAGLATGLPIVIAGVVLNFSWDWDPEVSFFFGGAFNYWGSLSVSGAYLGLVMLACRQDRLPGLRKRLAAIGQTALSNYLFHSIVCTTIFYGHGLGLFGSVGRAAQVGIAVVIWAVQLWLTPLWLARFRFGPFEWLWRSLTYLPPSADPALTLTGAFDAFAHSCNMRICA